MMKKGMANSISMTWQLLCDDHGFTREHYNQLKKFSPEALREIIAEIACCHPSTSILLRNKWLTPPEDIPEQVTREYERRIQNCPSFRSEKEAESWLNELSFAVFCFQSRNLKNKSNMKTRKQKETNEKEIHLLEHKGYERMMNEIMPVQQAEVYRKPTKKVVEEAVKELNPDTNSLGSRG